MEVPIKLQDAELYVKFADHMQVLRESLAEKDAEIARWKSLSRDEHVRFLAESKENLLQQYVNLTQMYGEQKHEIRRLKAALQQIECARYMEAKK